MGSNTPSRPWPEGSPFSSEFRDLINEGLQDIHALKDGQEAIYKRLARSRQQPVSSGGGAARREMIIGQNQPKPGELNQWEYAWQSAKFDPVEMKMVVDEDGPNSGDPDQSLLLNRFEMHNDGSEQECTGVTIDSEVTLEPLMGGLPVEAKLVTAKDADGTVVKQWITSAENAVKVVCEPQPPDPAS